MSVNGNGGQHTNNGNNNNEDNVRRGSITTGAETPNVNTPAFSGGVSGGAANGTSSQLVVPSLVRGSNSSVAPRISITAVATSRGRSAFSFPQPDYFNYNRRLSHNRIGAM